MAKVKVWDAPTRLVHWGLAAAFVFSWWSHEDHLAWHRVSGAAIAALLVFRLWWGFAGPATARFKGLLGGPAHIRAYLKGEGPKVVGHNPLGGWSVAAMLAALTAQVGLGLFAIDVDGLEAGPFARFVSFDAARWAAKAHGVVFNVLLALIALHLTAVAAYAVRGRNLTAAMLTGKAEIDAEAPAPATRTSLAVGLALAAATFALLIWQLKAAWLL